MYSASSSRATTDCVVPVFFANSACVNPVSSRISRTSSARSTFPHVSTAASKPMNARPGQLLAIPQLPPVAFESAHHVRISIKCYKTLIDNKALFLFIPHVRPPCTPTYLHTFLDRPRLTVLDLLP